MDGSNKACKLTQMSLPEYPFKVAMRETCTNTICGQRRAVGNHNDQGRIGLRSSKLFVKSSINDAMLIYNADAQMQSYGNAPG